MQQGPIKKTYIIQGMKGGGVETVAPTILQFVPSRMSNLSPCVIDKLLKRVLHHKREGKKGKRGDKKTCIYICIW